MAPPLFAFTSLDGKDYALVGQSTENETWQALKTRARQTIDEIASGAATPAWGNRLRVNLRVVTHADALREPYRRYIAIPFDLSWIQARADADRRQSS